MNFSQPMAFWLLILLPFALVLAVARERFSHRVQREFALRSAAVQRWRSVARITTICLATLALIVALSGPQFRGLVKDDPRRQLKLAVGLDVSKSMLAEDVLSSEPGEVANRLNAGRHFARRLFEELAGEQAGLFFFARNGIEVVAPTRDQGFLRYMVQHTRLAEMTESGSDLKAAMLSGSALLGNHGSQSTGAIILISDGEDTENNLAELTKQSDQMKMQNRPVFTIGVGRPNEVYIPIRRPGTEGIDGFYTDTAGHHLRTRMQPTTLQTIARDSGGRFFTLEETTPGELISLLPALMSQTAKPAKPLPRARGFADWTPFFAVIGLAFYVAHCLL